MHEVFRRPGVKTDETCRLSTSGSRRSGPAGPTETVGQAPREVLAPAAVDQRDRGGIRLDERRHPGLRPGVDDDRRREGEVVALDDRAPSVDVGGGLEAREHAPEKRALVLRGRRRVVREDDERPGRDRGVRREPVARKARSDANDGPSTTSAPGTEDGGGRGPAGSGPRNSAGRSRIASPRPRRTPLLPSFTFGPV